jgi:ABC-2 type transport system permease protein
MMASLSRIHAVILRHYYIFIKSPARIVEIVYWPTINMIIWGFVSRYFAVADGSAVTYALTTLLGCVLLWDLLFRVQVGMSMAYLEEVWARNMGHLFVSPLRPHEWWLGMMAVALLRGLVGSLPALVLAVPFYQFSVLDLGLPLVFFFFNLMMMGWWLGLLINALLMRAGPGAEGLAWMFSFALAPFCAVYYPSDILPQWMQSVGAWMPASHVFNGIRALVNDGVFEVQHMWRALALNALYTVMAAFVLNAAFNNARREGTILQAGE